MPNPVSALHGAVHRGYVTVQEIGPLGMVTLRGDLADADLAAAVKAATGCAMPGLRRIVTLDQRSAGWMSPDELLLILPCGEVEDALRTIDTIMGTKHFLAVDVSDARAVFQISGEKAREVLAKLCPVDLSPTAFQPGEIRRTRAAQVAAALWMSGPEAITLVSFRSVAGYVTALLQNAAAPGAEVGLF